MDDYIIYGAVGVAIVDVIANLIILGTIGWLARRKITAVLSYLFLGKSVENMTFSHIIKRLSYSIGCLAFGIYVGFIGIAYYNTEFEPKQCQIPYVSFLATWPLWTTGVMNEHRDFGLVAWSIGQCIREGK